MLHLPDQIWTLDRRREEAIRYSYEFQAGEADGGPAAR